MSDTYELACHKCKSSVWIGQSSRSSSSFCFYSGEPETLLKEFLWKHFGHRLEFNEMQSLEIRGIIREEDPLDYY